MNLNRQRVLGFGDMTAAGFARWHYYGNAYAPYFGDGRQGAIQFPDRTLSASTEPFMDGARFLRYWKENPPAGLVPPVSEQIRSQFVICNWLLRPPITDAEILVMPLADLLNLYYNLAVGVKCGEEPKANPIASRGLPHGFAVANDRLLQSRIFALRTDLHNVTDLAGNVFPVLVPPNSLVPPNCDETDTMVQGLSALASIAAFGVGAVVGAAIATAISLANTFISTIVQRIDLASIEKAAQEAQGMARAILNGIKTAAAMVPEPVLTDTLRQNLLTNYTAWVNVIAQYEPLAATTNTQWSGLPWPEITIPYWYSNPPNWPLGINTTAGVETDGAIDGFFMSHTSSAYFKTSMLALTPGGSRYATDWTPYRKFFYSDKVANMVLTPAQQAAPHVANAIAGAANVITPPPSSAAATLAPHRPVTSSNHPGGLGLAALLLLLI